MQEIRDVQALTAQVRLHGEFASVLQPPLLPPTFCPPAYTYSIGHTWGVSSLQLAEDESSGTWFTLTDGSVTYADIAPKQTEVKGGPSSGQNFKPCAWEFTVLGRESCLVF